jgi:stage II sporulation protein E
MELLLDNLKNAFIKGKHARIKVAEIPDKRLLIQIAVIGGLSFLIGRVALYYSLEPAAIAFMTALMAKSKANLYALPLVVIGMISSFGTSYNYLGQLAALILCTLLFFFLGTKRLSMIHRALISAGILVLTKTIYYLLSGLFFLYDGATAAMEIALLFVLIYTFWSFLTLLEQGLNNTRNPVETLAVLSTMAMIAVAGTGTYQIGPVSILHLVSLLLTLWIGNHLGPAEGGMIGILTGLFSMIAAFETPAFIGILGVSGMVAGLLKGHRRYLSGICFAGAVLSFGLAKGFPDLYLSAFEPIIAVAFYLLIPQVLIERINLWLSIVKQDDTYYELVGRKRVKAELKGYQEVFDKLALSCGAAGAFHPTRDIMAQQFKGMSRAVEHMAKDLTPKSEPLMPHKEKYHLELGVASYAKEGRMSGDSYLCTEIKKGEYMIALSDGMGKGMRASEESTLTVNTLHQLLKAGFEEELSLKMINSILLQRSPDEIFSTVDMGCINLFTGRAKFFKIGAAASFIKRGDEVKAIKVSALPMGIIERVPVESINLQLRKGDQMIIVSDGITEADRSEQGPRWVQETIREIRSKDPQTMADLITNRAIQRCGIKEKDDMTVIVVNVL